MLKTLGVEQGDNILIERPFPVIKRDQSIERFSIDQLSLSLFEAPSKMIEQRRDLEKEHPDRYVDAGFALYSYDGFVKANNISNADAAHSTLKAEPDVPPIFIDAGVREARSKHLGISFPATIYSPVAVRRSIASALARESLQSGTTFWIAFFNLAFALSKIVSDDNSWGWVTVISAGLIAAIFTSLLLLFKLRRQI